MLFQESETVELKEIVVDDIKKEIIAFANCNGGKLYVGVQDDGTVVGLDNPDGAALQIVAVDIQRGTQRPYYIAQKGLRPEGVYVRQGYSSVPATDTQIRRMIKETDGDRFEDMRSLNQDLTFEAAKKEKDIQRGQSRDSVLPLSCVWARKRGIAASYL